MAFSFGGAVGGTLSGGAAGSAFGPVGAAIGSGLGFLGGGFLGGDQKPRAGQIKAEELSMELARLGISDALTQKDLFNLLVGGGPFSPSSVNVKGGDLFGAFQQTPTGPAFNLVRGGLEGEERLSQQRQALAEQLLGNFGQDAGTARNFGLRQLGLGDRALGSQEALFGDQFRTSVGNLGLNNQLIGQIGDFLQSGGGPSDAQRTQIGGIFDSQRNIGHSNLDKKFQDDLQDLRNLATIRGLRATDTPIQDRGGQILQELIRNRTNLESSLGGQQAQALLNVPFQQAQFGAGLMNQLQGQNLNILNSFSHPINNAFGQQQFINSLGQFGAQFSPSQFSGNALNNFTALLNGGGFTQGIPAFSPSGFAASQPGLLQNLTSNIGTGLGAGFGKTVGTGIGGMIFKE